jgi:hypothetical protein
MVHNIFFESGEVTASCAESGGAGIGSGTGSESDGSSIVGNIVVYDGVFDARGGSSASGIGAAFDGRSIVEYLTILNGSVRAIGAVPIEAANVAIGGNELILDITCRSSSEKPCIKGNAIGLGNGSIRVSAESEFVSQSPAWVGRGLKLWIEYSGESTAEGISGIS